MFDVTIQTIDMQVERLPEAVMLGLIVGLGLPAGPAGMIQIPVGAVKTFMSDERAVEQGELLAKVGGMTFEEWQEEQAEKERSAKSDIIVASNLQGIDQAAALQDKFRQGGQPRG